MNEFNQNHAKYLKITKQCIKCNKTVGHQYSLCFKCNATHHPTQLEVSDKVYDNYAYRDFTLNV